MDDFWDLTVEEMDAIENEALQRINQQRNSSSSSSLPIPNEVHTSSQGARILPSTLAPKPNTGLLIFPVPFIYVFFAYSLFFWVVHVYCINCEC
jgi:cephalosporin-C deacetylase-like acetyl esterase